MGKLIFYLLSLPLFLSSTYHLSTIYLPIICLYISFIHHLSRLPIIYLPIYHLSVIAVHLSSVCLLSAYLFDLVFLVKAKKPM